MIWDCTHCWCSAHQLSVTCINQCTLLLADSNCGVLGEAEARYCQHRASCKRKKKKNDK